MKYLNTNQSVIQRLLACSPRGGAWMRMFFMLILIMTSSASVMAQEKYGIKVAGVEVTESNCNDLTIIPGVSGKTDKAWFHPNSRTLVLENATIEAGGPVICNEGCSDLNISVKGVCTISSLKHEAISIHESTTICSDIIGKLIVKAQNSGGIVMENAPLKIENCIVEVEGESWGIAGYCEDTEVLTIHNSDVMADIRNKVDEGGAIADIGDLVLNYSYITQPEGAAFDATLHSVAKGGKPIKDKVVIEAKKYGIKVAGVEVTEANCADLSVIPGVEGKMSYNTGTNTLTMEDCTIIPHYGNKGIVIEKENVKINVLGTNSIRSLSICINVDKASTISGTGTLRLKSDLTRGISMHAPLTVEGVKLYVEGKQGIGGENGMSGDVLTIRNAYVEATGSAKGSICKIQDITLDGCSIILPEDAAFDATLHSVAKDGILVTDKVVIGPDNYGILIAGKEVTRNNCADLSGIEGVEGKLSYNYETNTLTMEDCTINAGGDDDGIMIVKKDDVKINVLGTNSITTNSACITIRKTSTINGSGTLRLKSDNHCGIDMSSPLTVEGVKLYTEGNWGFAGTVNQTTGNTLTIRNAYVEVTGTGPDGSILDIENLNLEGCSIIEPEDAAFDAALHAVAQHGNVVKDKVVIEPNYRIRIAGVDVMKKNCADLSVIDGVEGKLSYDPETNTLTMQDCTINSTGDTQGIYINGNNDVKINLLGNNVIKSEKTCIHIYNTSTISGSGVLRLESKTYSGITMTSPLIVEGVKLYVEGAYGIIGNDGKSDDMLTIRNAYVEATGIRGSICFFKNLILDGCSIIQPVGAYFSSVFKCVMLYENLVTDKVVIGSDASSINDITADVPARKQGIFTVLGVKLTQQWENLPAGIYIVNGKKCVKR